MEIFIERENKTLKKRFNGSVKKLLESLKINNEEVLVVKENQLLTEDDVLKDKDKIKIMSVVSGG